MQLPDNYGNQTASATENTEQTWVQQSPGRLGNQKSSDLKNPAAYVKQLPAGNLRNQKAYAPENTEPVQVIQTPMSSSNIGGGEINNLICRTLINKGIQMANK